MSFLSDERVRRLHKQFLDAGERFPDLCFAAATDPSDLEWLTEGERWPFCPVGLGEFVLGLPESKWREILFKPPGRLFTPLSTRWLRIDTRLWEGAFYCDGELWSDLQKQFAHLEEGIREFERLAQNATGHYCSSPTPHPLVDWPLKPEPSDRWFEIVCSADFVEVDDREGLLLRRIPGDVFTASARTVEILSQGKESHVAACDEMASDVSNQPPETRRAGGKKRGRRPDTDPKADKSLFEAWKTRRYKTYAELAEEKNATALEVKRAIDRHRKRIGKRRNKSGQ